MKSFEFVLQNFSSDGGSEFSVKPGGELYKILIEKFQECLEIYLNNKSWLFYKPTKMIVYVSKGDKKGAIVERFNRTLKSRIEMMFTETGKHVWVDTLDYFIANYNDSYHRSIKMSPSSVTLENQHQVFETLYPENERPAHCDFKLNDRVRIAVQKNLFDKGYIKSALTEFTSNNFQIFRLVE